MRVTNLALVAALALAAPVAGGCASARYSFWEVFGKEKRDLLKSDLRGLVNDQNEAKQTFGTALDRVKALSGFHGGELEAQYDKLKSAQSGAQSSAKAIDSRIADIEQVAGDLFDEWAKEIGQMQTASLKADSRQKLDATKERYDTMHASMVGARRKMDPALTLLNDHVLYLKHNLNAAAIGSLGSAVDDVEASIKQLQQSIEASVREAQGFIDTMQ
jgi:outer membrane murein-binding lipoprotein Lpp